MEEEIINFEPHFNTLTKQGQNHFLRPVDALAEFIDNSIQACRGVTPERNIEVKFFLGKSSSSDGFLMVMDNGCGMNKETIKEYATFSLDQETRNATIRPDDKSFISKFGVGVKLAGFYFGNRIKVLTKTQDENCVHKFVLDSERFEEKYNRGDQVFKDKIITLTRYDKDVMFEDDERAYSEIPQSFISFMKEKNHFTIFIIKLRKDIIQNLLLRNNYLHMKTLLSEIYHFHIFPHHCAEAILSNYPGMIYKESNRTQRNQITPIVESPLTIHYSIIIGDQILFNEELEKQTDDYISKAISRSKSIFPFSMEIPDPKPDPPTSTMASQIDHVTKRLVNGYLLYFPFFDGHETTPEAFGNIEGDGSRGSEEKEESSTFEEIIKVFWQDRLVPESTVSTFDFFPEKQRKRKTEESNRIPQNWKARIRGFIFFDWTFRHISNNKLKIRVDPDLNRWLNSKEVKDKTLFYPNHISKKFEDWIITCHKNFDKEFIFSGKYDPPISSNDVQNSTNKTYFECLSFGADEDKYLSRDQEIKIKEKKGDIFAKIVDFYVDEKLMNYEAYYIGTGKFRYQRLPNQLFGNKIYTSSLNLLQSKLEDLSFSKKEFEKALKVLMPIKVELTLFEVESEDGLKIENNSEFLAGKKYSKIGAQLFNEEGNIISSVSDANDNFAVQFSIGEKNFGRTQDLYCYDSSEKRDKRVTGTGKKAILKSHFSIYNVSFTTPGPQSLLIEVLSPISEECLLLVEVPIIVISQNISKISLVGNPFSNSLQLGNPLPDFDLQLCDENDNPVFFNGNIIISLSSSLIQSFNRNSRKAFFSCQIQNSDKGKISFSKAKNSDWIVLPRSESLIFSPEIFQDKKDIPFTLSVKFPQPSEKFQLSQITSSQFQSIPSNNELSLDFNVSFMPGPPMKLKMLFPETEPIQIQASQSLPTLHLVCYDNWGNRTGPIKGDNWKVIFKEGPLQLPPKASRSFTPSGEIILSSLPISCDSSLLTQGQHIEQVISIETKVSTKAEFSPLTISFLVIPDNIPKSLEVIYLDQLIDNQTVQPGSILEPISFRVFDSKGVLIDNKEIIQNDAHFECSWAVENGKGNKRKRKQISSDLTLPPLHVPGKIEADTLDYHFSLVLEDVTLSYSFSLKIIVGIPKQWKIITTESFIKGLMIDEERDLKSKIIGICLIDEFENPISIEEESLAPRLEISNKVEEVEDENEEIDKNLPGKNNIVQNVELMFSNFLIDQLDSSQVLHPIQGFVIKDNQSISSDFKSCESIVLKVIDSQNKFDQDVIETKLISGFPSLLALSSMNFNVNPPNGAADINVAKFSKVDDLTIHLFDRFNQPLKVIPPIKLEIIDPNQQCVITKDNMKKFPCKVKLNYDFNTFLNPSTQSMTSMTEEHETFDFLFKASYKIDHEVVEITPAILRCRIIKFNNVTDISISLKAPTLSDVPVSQLFQSSQLALNNIQLIREEEGKIPSYRFALRAGESFPTLLVQTITDDEILFLPNIEQFTAKISHKLLCENVRNLNFSDCFSCIRDETSNSFSFNPTSALDTKNTGKYNISLTYNETRSTLSSLPDSLRKIKLEIKVIIEPGTIAKLEILPSCLSRFQESVILSKDRECRLLGRKIQFRLLDSYGNECSITNSFSLACAIVSPRTNQDINTFPELDSADEHGYVYAEIIEENDKEYFCFSELLLKLSPNLTPNSIEENEYSLHFILFHNSIEFGDSGKITQNFKYVNNASLQLKLTEIDNKLKDLEAIRSQYHQLRLSIQATRSQIDRILNESPDLSNVIRETVEALDLNILRELYRARIQDVNSMMNRVTQIRPAKKRPHYPDPLKVTGYDVIGLVVDLGFCDDNRDSYILSWAASYYMDSVVVQDSETAITLFNNGVKTMALNQLNPFKIRNGQNKFSPRSEEERKSGRLPLPPIKIDDPNITISGNPEYLVNLIRLPADQEHLRDNLFFSIFRKSILFDDHKSAAKYREYLISRNEDPPTIFTRDGAKIPSVAVFDPSPAGKLQNPSQLEFIFGEQPTKDSPVFAQTNYEKEILKDLIECIEKRQSKEESLSKIDIREVDSSISKLEKEKQNLTKK